MSMVTNNEEATSNSSNDDDNGNLPFARSEASNEDDNARNNSNHDDEMLLLLNSLTIDCLVEVRDRMWPGMNKQGGIARVKAIDREQQTVNVHFVVERRKEKNVPIEFITLAPQYDAGRQSEASNQQKLVYNQNKNLRDRSMLLGRCKRCGSLRKDCGNCDWLEEERLREHQLQQNAENSNENKQENKQTLETSEIENNKAPKSKSKKAKHAKKIEEAERWDLSSDEELEQIIQDHQRKFKRFKRLKARQDRKWDKYVQEQEEEEAQAIRNAQDAADEESSNFHIHGKKKNRRRILESTENEDANTTQDDDENTSTCSFSSDDEQYLPLQQLASRLTGDRNRILQVREKYKDRKTASDKKKRKCMTKRRRETTSKAPTRKPMTPRKSILESVSKEQCKLPTNKEANLGPAVSEDNLRVSSANNAYIDVQNGTPVAHQVGSTNDPEQNDEPFPMEYNDDSAGESDINNSGWADGVFVDSPTYSTQDDNQNFATDETKNDEDDGDRYSRLAARNVTAAKNASAEASGADLQDFIEPEGEEIAENLPQDIVDRARQIPYKDLPDFFDAEATNIEDELLPNAKLKVAEMERDLNKWKEIQQSESQAGNSLRAGISRDILIQTCEEIFTDLRTNLIRNGIDQCLSALRQLVDDKRYRRERQRLTDEERKRIRRERGTLIVVRDLKMDKLERESEALVRKVRDALFTLGSSTDAGDVDSEESSSNDVASESEEESEDDIVLNDLAHSSYQADFGINESSIERDLPPWHRHQHASLARQNSYQREEDDPVVSSSKMQRRFKRTIKLSRDRTNDEVIPNQKKRKKSRISSRGETDADPKTGSNKENRVTTGPLRRPQKRKIRDSSCQNRSEFPTSGSGISLPEGTSVDDSAGLHEEDFDADYPAESETNFDGPTLEQLLAEGGSGPVTTGNNNIRGQTVQEERNLRHREPQQKPIADRMQAFLDANAEIAGDVNEVSMSPSRPNGQPKRRRRAGIPNDNTDPGSVQSRQLSSQSRIATATHGLEDDGSSAGIDASNLFSLLHDKRRVPTASHESPHVEHAREEIISDTCESLLQMCSMASPGPFMCTLRALTAKVTDQVEAGSANNVRDAVVLVFITLLKLLQRHGTLQNMVSRGEIRSIKAHVALLSETIKLVRRCGNLLQPTESPPTYHVFSNARQSSLFNFLILQLVDTLYSIFHNEAWALPFEENRRSSILSALVPLRDELGKATVALPGEHASSLAEAGCKSIANHLESQNWRVVESPSKHAFVSSVDPGAWKDFLRNGEDPKKPSGKS